MNSNLIEDLNSTLIEDLNDLIRINNDRISGYEKAVEEAKTLDVDLHAIFNTMADDSRKYVAELTEQVHKLGGESATDSTTIGKIYRVWMDVKATFAGKDRKTILESCEFGEDAAQKTYKEALFSDAEMSTETRQLIAKQQAALKEAHDLIRKYRDMQP